MIMTLSTRHEVAEEHLPDRPEACKAVLSLLTRATCRLLLNTNKGSIELDSR